MKKAAIIIHLNDGKTFAKRGKELKSYTEKSLKRYADEVFQSMVAEKGIVVKNQDKYKVIPLHSISYISVVLEQKNAL